MASEIFVHACHILKWAETYLVASQNVRGGSEKKNMCGGRVSENIKICKGGLQNFPFRPSQDLKWNSPYIHFAAFIIKLLSIRTDIYIGKVIGYFWDQIIFSRTAKVVDLPIH